MSEKKQKSPNAVVQILKNNIADDLFKQGANISNIPNKDPLLQHFKIIYITF